MTEITKQEQILVPLRELYRRDTNHRKIIAEYAAILILEKRVD